MVFHVGFVENMKLQGHLTSIGLVDHSSRKITLSTQVLKKKNKKRKCDLITLVDAKFLLS